MTTGQFVNVETGIIVERELNDNEQAMLTKIADETSSIEQPIPIKETAPE